MATAQRTVDVILEAIAGAGAVSARKMFGEWGIYCDGKLVALVCDDQLFVKITAAGRTFLGDAAELLPRIGGRSRVSASTQSGGTTRSGCRDWCG